jgi:hypothetical protein
MKRVEIIGVNYVGKSTFLKKLTNSGEEYPFLVIDDIRREYRKSHPLQWYSERVLQMILSKFSISYYLNPYKIKLLNDLYADFMNRFSYVIDLCFRAENSGVTIADKIQTYEDVKKIIEKLNFIDENSDSLQLDILLIEEFFLHRNDLIFRNLKLLEAEKLLWKNDRLLKPVAVILLSADKEFLKNNIIKRKNDRLLNKQHTNMKMAEILKDLSEQQIQYSKLTSLLEDNGVQSLKLDSSMSFLVQRERCLDFIQKI